MELSTKCMEEVLEAPSGKPPYSFDAGVDHFNRFTLWSFGAYAMCNLMRKGNESNSLWKGQLLISLIFRSQFLCNRIKSKFSGYLPIWVVAAFVVNPRSLWNLWTALIQFPTVWRLKKWKLVNFTTNSELSSKGNCMAGNWLIYQQQILLVSAAQFHDQHPFISGAELLIVTRSLKTLILVLD